MAYSVLYLEIWNEIFREIVTTAVEFFAECYLWSSIGDEDFSEMTSVEYFYLAFVIILLQMSHWRLEGQRSRYVRSRLSRSVLSFIISGVILSLKKQKKITRE